MHCLKIFSVRYPNSTSNNENQINEYYWVVRVEGGSNWVIVYLVTKDSNGLTLLYNIVDSLTMTV